mgnify:CR=1 FL=1
MQGTPKLVKVADPKTILVRTSESAGSKQTVVEAVFDESEIGGGVRISALRAVAVLDVRAGVESIGMFRGYDRTPLPLGADAACVIPSIMGAPCLIERGMNVTVIFDGAVQEGDIKIELMGVPGLGARMHDARTRIKAAEASVAHLQNTIEHARIELTLAISAAAGYGD